MNLLIFLAIVFLLYINADNFKVNKKIIILGSLIAYFLLFIKKENFALSAALITNKNNLEDNKYYLIGDLDTKYQVNQTVPPVGDSPNCKLFPTKAYKLAPTSDASCNLNIESAYDPKVDSYSNCVRESDGKWYKYLSKKADANVFNNATTIINPTNGILGPVNGGKTCHEQATTFKKLCGSVNPTCTVNGVVPVTTNPLNTDLGINEAIQDNYYTFTNTTTPTLKSLIP